MLYTEAWYDDDVIKAVGEDGKASDYALKVLLDTAVSAIEMSTAEQMRIKSTIQDLERYLGRPLDVSALPDLAVYDRYDDSPNLKYNVCFSVVSTIVSRIANFRPRAQFVPEHGNYKTNRLSRDLTSASDAWCKEQRYQEVASLALRDALTGPGGVLKFYIEDDQPQMMRVPSWEIKIDEEDWKYGTGLCSYHVRYITLAQALRSWGKTEKAREDIESGAQRLSAVVGYEKYTNRNGRLMVRVIDAYHVGPGGHHVMLVGDHVALNEAWEHDAHPFLIMRFEARLQGPWGMSAITPIRSIQDEVDNHLFKMRQAHHLASSLFISSSAEQAPDLTNEVVQHVKIPPGGGGVSFHNPQAVDQSSYHWWDILKNAAFEILGVSPQAAQALKPAAVTAAVAIDAVTDIQTDRLSQLSQMWERVITDVADWWYRLSADCGDAPKEYQVTDRGRSKRVKFTAGKSKPEIRTFPTSLFGQSIPARLQKAMDAVKAGWFDKEEILRILDVPDLGQITDLQLAEFYCIENMIDELLEDGKYETPDDWINPVRLFKYARSRYLLALADGSYPPENMSLMRKLLDYTQARAEEATNPKPQQQAPQQPQIAGPAAIQQLAPPAPAIQAPPLPGLTATPEVAAAA